MLVSDVGGSVNLAAASEEAGKVTRRGRGGAPAASPKPKTEVEIAQAKSTTELKAAKSYAETMQKELTNVDEVIENLKGKAWGVDASKFLEDKTQEQSTAAAKIVKFVDDESGKVLYTKELAEDMSKSVKEKVNATKESYKEYKTNVLAEFIKKK